MAIIITSIIVILFALYCFFVIRVEDRDLKKRKKENENTLTDFDWRNFKNHN